MRISLIAAMSRNRVIGKDGQLPWHLPGDLAFFKKMTRGKPIIMGRKTCESLGRPLPGRKNIVLTRDPGFVADGFVLVADPEAALAAATPAEEVMICGGSSIYALFLPRADRLILTLVDAEVEGDTFFPEFDQTDWREVERGEHGTDDRNPLPRVESILERA